jgi:hypothetical protein
MFRRARTRHTGDGSKSNLSSITLYYSEFKDTEEDEMLFQKTGYRITVDDRDQEVLMFDQDGGKFKYETEKAYEKVAKYLTYYVEMRIFEQFGFKDAKVPFKADRIQGEFSTAEIFVSHDWKENENKALILIQGSGKVSPGIWSRKAMVNDSLNMGTMLPQVKFANDNGMSCLILNPNFQKDDDGVPVEPRIDSKEKHAVYVLKKYLVNRCKAEKVFIIAHSYGGKLLIVAFKKFAPEFEERVVAVAFTDSAHKGGFEEQLVDAEEEIFFETKCKHWVKSDKKLGSKVKSKSDALIPCVSAGTEEHQWTTGKSWPEIQEFFQEKAGEELVLSETLFEES